jgi:ATP-dependent DNA helicase RecG
MIRLIIDEYLSYAAETLHDHLLKKFKLMGLRDALFALHFPDSFEQAEQARRRLAFNEVFFMQYYFAISKKLLQKNCRKKAVSSDSGLLKKFFASLPFELTADQRKSIDEIQKDIQSPFPMNRLLQGDVGSGKTVVAMASAIITKECDRQTAVMAPTEILALQHYQNFLNIMPETLKIGLLTGSTTQAKKKELYASLESGDIDVLIGTHALIQGSVVFKDLGLTIIDEQHRFGVEQRGALSSKGENTDLLVMTATPIPRSLSLTLYGDLDVSLIRSKPANRKPITTLAFPYSRIKGVYNSMEKYISQGRQIYYVLPLIEETEKLDLTSAIEAYNNLVKIFPHRKVALMHGRMKQKEREEAMDQFKQGEIDIMVATTVIEVGIDVPNASIIVIEHSDRFGLSQLHQLRGRVGRGDHQSFCILIYKDELNGESMQRINVLIATDDGFVISEEDLKLRGAGELLGTQQHGHAGSWEFLDLNKDLDLILSSRNEAAEYADAVQNIEEAVTKHISSPRRRVSFSLDAN